MISSVAVAGWIAFIAFWVLLAAGWFAQELRVRGITVFLLLWIAGRFGLPHIPYGDALFMPLVAILDIALVFIVFKGDIRLH
jgi:hypothetical protein